jgi:cell division protein FtsI/penicillin-binding protein 2
MLMILQGNFYSALASGSHDSSSELVPKRGAVYVQDTRNQELFPLAINHDLFILFADTREIKSDDEANTIANKLAEIFHYDDTRKLEVFLQLNKRTDPYEPIEKKVDESIADQVKDLSMSGIGLVRVPFRFYPEHNSAAAVIGFVGQDGDRGAVGRYGVEGYWQKELAGFGGFVEGATNAGGGWIPLYGWAFRPAQDGADIILTIDRTLQYKACQRLQRGMKEYGAKSASLVMMNPQTGAIMAMCDLPDFDPNKYNEIDSVDVYNNDAIFTAYEPGSIFKPLTMAAAINEGLVGPHSPFYDAGVRSDLCSKPIKNANDKVYGNQDMTGVLENSINTGVVYLTEKMGRERFVKYVRDYGFGIKTGIELDSETAGTIDTLLEKKKNSDKVDCYAATASFGQGIMATPLQMVAAFSSIVNGGRLMKPYIVGEVRYSDGHIEKKKPEEIRQILSKNASDLTSGMLVTVVEKHSTGAKVPGYYVGGKTGTAQIAGPNGYTLETNQSFIGFAPAEDPKFVILVKYEKPNRAWAESTALPVFADVAKFALEYYHIPPNR